MEKTVWRCLKNIKIELPCDPAIPLLPINLEEMESLSQIVSAPPTFIVALFTTAKIYKQSKHPSVDNWIKKMWYNTILKRYKIEENSALYSNIDGPRGHYAKCDKPDTEMQMPYDLTFM